MANLCPTCHTGRTPEEIRDGICYGCGRVFPKRASKLRLLVHEECNRACPGCCNKGWDLKALPVCSKMEGYKEVMLTGGEPMLDPQRVKELAHEALVGGAMVYMYTAKVDDLKATFDVLASLDGICLTLHDQNDVEPFLALNRAIPEHPWLVREIAEGKYSLRLNVFAGVQIPDGTDLSFWKVKPGMKWIKDCPLPQDEVFMRAK